MKRLGQSLVARWLLGACTGLSLFVSTGCQLDVAGQTLPSPYYLKDDIQYFPAGPEFQLSREAAAMQAFAAEEKLRQGNSTDATRPID